MKDLSGICEPRFVGELIDILNLQEELPQLTDHSSTHTSSTTIVSIDKTTDSKEKRHEIYISSEDIDPKAHTKAVQLKDCGYSWIVLGAMVLSNILTAGYVKSFGIICNSVLAEYPNTSGAEAGLLMGLLIGCRAILTPVAGALGVKFGSRIITIFGTILCSAGLISSYFCNSVWQLSLTLGAMTGVGACLIESVQVVTLTHYFEEKLSVANGVRVSGNPIGSIMYPIILLLLGNEFGFRAIRLILGSIFLHILICALLTRSPEIHRKIQILNHVRGSEIDACKKGELYKTLNKNIPSPAKKSERKSFEFRYFVNYVYWIFVLSSIVLTFALPTISFYIPIYGKSFGLSAEEISLLLSSQSLIDTILRITIGFISNRNLYKKAHGFIFSLFLGSIGAILIPFCTHLWEIYLATFLYSFASAGSSAFINVILTEQFGKASISTTWGIVRLGQGIFNFIIPSIIGAIIDASDSFVVAFIFMGGGMFFSAILLLLEPIIIKITNSPVIIT
ncbi:UNVERIFIED_CONTAM: hypothetical protein RMT77_011684 [Armadillidium vulgare]